LSSKIIISHIIYRFHILLLESNEGGELMPGIDVLGRRSRDEKEDSLLFFFLLLVIIFFNCGLFDDGAELLFFFLLLVLLFGGGSFFRGFGVQSKEG